MSNGVVCSIYKISVLIITTNSSLHCACFWLTLTDGDCGLQLKPLRGFHFTEFSRLPFHYSHAGKTNVQSKLKYCNINKTKFVIQYDT